MLMRSCEGIFSAIEKATYGVLLLNYNVKFSWINFEKKYPIPLPIIFYD